MPVLLSYYSALYVKRPEGIELVLEYKSCIVNPIVGETN